MKNRNENPKEGGQAQKREKMAERQLLGSRHRGRREVGGGM